MLHIEVALTGDVAKQAARPSAMAAEASRAMRMVRDGIGRAGARPGGTSPADGGDLSPAHGHGHLWVLRDGTPVHVPPGRLVVSDDGRLACHLCGRWFAHLGAHLRRHGWTAAQHSMGAIPAGRPPWAAGW
jgi:hypothetical protein